MRISGAEVKRDLETFLAADHRQQQQHAAEIAQLRGQIEETASEHLFETNKLRAEIVTLRAEIERKKKKK